jgi:hypothetical protein
MSHRIYVYNCEKDSNQGETIEIIESKYVFPLFFAPLIALNPEFAPTYYNSEDIESDGIFTDKAIGVEQLKKFYNFIESNPEWIYRPDEFKKTKEKIFDFLEEYCTYNSIQIDATDVYGMSDTDFDEQAKNFYSAIENFNKQILDAIDANDKIAFAKAFNDYPECHWDFLDYLNTENYQYGLVFLDTYEYDKIGDAILYQENGLWGLKNRKKQIICEPQFTTCCSFSETSGLSIVTKNDKLGFLNKSGELVIDCIYEDLHDFSTISKLAVAKKNSQFGCINPKGEVIIPFEYDDCSEFTSIAFVTKNNKVAIINRKNEFLTDFIFDDYNFEWLDSLEEINYNKGNFSRFFQVQTGEFWNVYDAQENVLVLSNPTVKAIELTIVHEYFGLLYYSTTDILNQTDYFNAQFKPYNFTPNTLLNFSFPIRNELYFVLQIDRKFGIYSDFEKKWIIEPIYQQISHQKEDSTSGNEAIFQISTAEYFFIFSLESIEINKNEENEAQYQTKTFTTETQKVKTIDLFYTYRSYDEDVFVKRYYFKTRDLNKNRIGVFCLENGVITHLLAETYESIWEYSHGVFFTKMNKKTGLISFKNEFQEVEAVYDFIDPNLLFAFKGNEVFNLKMDNEKGIIVRTLAEIYDQFDFHYYREHDFFLEKWQKKLDQAIIHLKGFTSTEQEQISRYEKDIENIKRLEILLENQNVHDEEIIDDIAFNALCDDQYQDVILLYNYKEKLIQLNYLSADTAYISYLTGKAFYYLGDTDASINLLSSAVEQDDALLDASLFLGWNYTISDEFDKAKSTAVAALQTAKNKNNLSEYDSNSVTNLKILEAVSQYCLDDIKGAYTFFKNNAIPESREATYYWQYRALSYLKNQSSEESLEKGYDFLKFMKENEMNHYTGQFYVIVAMAECYLDLDQKSKAVELLKNLQQHEPDNKWLSNKIKSMTGRFNFFDRLNNN